MTRDGNLASISSAFEGLWLALVTLTSVGYGRISPVTPFGKMIAVFAMIFGSFYYAMPLFIVGGSFYGQWKQELNREIERAKQMGYVTCHCESNLYIDL